MASWAIRTLSRKKPLILLAAGGTGGHLFPAQSLSEEMLARGWRVKLSTDMRGARFTSGFSDAVEIDVISASRFSGTGMREKILAPFKITKGILSTCSKFWKDRPDVIVGFGGYPSFPAMVAGGLYRIPRLIHEQNAVLGRVNQIFARSLGQVACGMTPTEIPKNVKALDIGNPVRDSIKNVGYKDYEFSLNKTIPILVMGGSQGASLLSRVVPPALTGLPIEIRKQLKISHQAREEDLNDVISFYAQSKIEAEVSPFFSDIAKRIRDAKLVISRSGASSIADITALGRPAIFIPLAIAKRNEQLKNAQSLTRHKAAIIIEESELSEMALSDVIVTLFETPSELKDMAKRSLEKGRMTAASDLADLAINLSTIKQ